VADPDPVIRGSHQFVEGDWEPVESEPFEVRTPVFFDPPTSQLGKSESWTHRAKFENPEPDHVKFPWLYGPNPRNNPDHEIGEIDNVSGKILCRYCVREVRWSWDRKRYVHD
jgi:hypothetical protein